MPVPENLNPGMVPSPGYATSRVAVAVLNDMLPS